MRISISLMNEKQLNNYPRLLAKDSKEFSSVKFKKIEFNTKFPKPVDSRVVLKSLHQTRDTTYSFKLNKVEDFQCRQRRKSISDGAVSTKIIHLDLKYPKTIIQQHQFLYKVKDLRRRAIKGRMKTKFEKSIKNIGTTRVSQFNPTNQHSQTSRDSIFGSLQDIKVLRTFTRDRPYYQRPLDKRCSEIAAESPSSPSVQIQKTEKLINIIPKRKTYVLLQMSKYKPKLLEQLKRDTIIKLLSETKETQPHTPAIQTRTLIQNKLQPYFSFPSKKSNKKSCLTSSSQRFKTC